MVTGTEPFASDDDEVEYEVERILAQRDVDGTTLYLVKWLGYSDEQCTWEPYESFSDPQTVVEWHQQLAQGDTLDDQEVAAVQDRMDAYVKAREDGDGSNEATGQGYTPKAIGHKDVLPHREENGRPKLTEPPTDPRPFPRDLSKPDRGSVKQRGQNKNALMTPNAALPQARSTTLSNDAARDTREESRRRETRAVAMANPRVSHDNKATRHRHYRVDGSFKNLRHQNNFFKLARREPAPDMSAIELRAPDDWQVSTKTNTSNRAGEGLSQTDEGGESWLFMPDKSNDNVDRAKTTLFHQTDGLAEDNQGQLVERDNDHSAPSEMGPPPTEAGVGPLKSTMSRQVLRARNGRTWFQGDIVVYLLFGDHAVGDVKLLHLPSWLRYRTLALKRPYEFSLSIHFLERHVVSVEDFSVLSRSLEKTTPALGAIEPYEDTVQATDSLAKHLEVNNVAAMWEYPGEDETLVMILYSCRANGWRHFGQKDVEMFEPRLHVQFRNKLPGFRLDYGPLGDTSMTHNDDGTASIIGTHDTGAKVQSPIDRFQSLKDQSMSEPDPASTSSEKVLKPYQTPTRLAQFPPTKGETVFPGNLEDLILGKDRSRKKPAVYIAFATSHPVQADATRRWVGEHITSLRNIYTDAEKNGWAEWCEEIDIKPAIILFHEDCPLYCDLKYFFRCLSSPAGATCYNMSFEHRGNGASSCVVSRLFPRGTAIIITERSMLKYPEESLYAMRWFEMSSKGKVESWKMCLIPDVVRWILQRVQECELKDRESYIGMLDVVNKLQWQSDSCNMRRSPSDPDEFVTKVFGYEQKGFILSVPDIHGYSASADTGACEMTDGQVDARDMILLDFFCGWAATKAAHYRRFLVLDDKHNNRTQKHSWHIKFWDPTKFKREVKS